MTSTVDHLTLLLPTSRAGGKPQAEADVDTHDRREDGPNEDSCQGLGAVKVQGAADEVQVTTGHHRTEACTSQGFRWVRNYIVQCPCLMRILNAHGHFRILKIGPTRKRGDHAKDSYRKCSLRIDGMDQRLGVFCQALLVKLSLISSAKTPG